MQRSRSSNPQKRTSIISKLSPMLLQQYLPTIVSVWSIRYYWMAHRFMSCRTSTQESHAWNLGMIRMLLFALLVEMAKSTFSTVEQRPKWQEWQWVGQDLISSSVFEALYIACYVNTNFPLLCHFHIWLGLPSAFSVYLRCYAYRILFITWELRFEQQCHL